MNKIIKHFIIATLLLSNIAYADKISFVSAKIYKNNKFYDSQYKIVKDDDEFIITDKLNPSNGLYLKISDISLMGWLIHMSIRNKDDIKNQLHDTEFYHGSFLMVYNNNDYLFSYNKDYKYNTNDEYSIHLKVSEITR